MRRSHRTLIALVALAAPALARGQTDVECKKTETQAECHARLKCKKDEEVEACQKRLRQGKGGERGDEEGRGGDRGDRDEGDRGDRDRGDRDGSDRWGDDGDDGGDRGDRGGGGGERGERAGRRRGGREGGGGEGGGYASVKTFGLGLELGEPTGLNGKLFFSEALALDFGIGWIYEHYYYGDGVHIYADLLWHPLSLVSTDAFELPFYIGGGLRYWDFEYCHRNVCGYDGSVIGIRIPIGIAFDFHTAPLDVFVQVVPVIDFVDDDYHDRHGDRVHAGIDASVGIRYWFF